MAAGKRSRAATKGLRPSKTITGAQRKARQINIEKARRAKKKQAKQVSKSQAAAIEAKKSGIKFKSRSGYGHSAAVGQATLTKKNIVGKVDAASKLLSKSQLGGQKGMTDRLIKGVKSGKITSLKISKEGGVEGRFSGKKMDFFSTGFGKGSVKSALKAVGL